MSDSVIDLSAERRAREAASGAITVTATGSTISLLVSDQDGGSEATLTPEAAERHIATMQRALDVVRFTRAPAPPPPSVEIPLGHGLVALVDAADAPRVQALTWHAWHKPGRPDVVYAQHTFRYGPGGRKAKTGAIWLHHFVLGTPKGKIVDHFDGNGLNCRRSNMRPATRRQNAQHVVLSKNQRRGGFKGVSELPSGKFQANIRGGAVGSDGKRKRLYLGSFPSAEQAARAYDHAAIEAFGDFAATNFPRQERRHVTPSEKT